MQPLLYFSTNQKAEPACFSEALLKGIAPDRGLYFPKKFPQLSKEEIASFADKEYFEIAYEVIRRFMVGQIPDEELIDLVKDAYDFDVPLEHVYEKKYVMRLDQGPTASFKDFAARMMGRLMHYYLKQQGRNLLILTATSGDTGSAIANAFYGLDSIQVLVLFPEKEVTNRQRKQMTTLGKNIQIVSIDGKFDDCQAMVKEAFADEDLDKLNLSSANSINIGRLVPQVVYYFWAYLQLCKADEEIIFSVPSGNFGDMMGGMIAKQMGLPVKRFVISTNENDEFTKFVETGDYQKIEPSINCISSAMNVGHPSNLSRLVALYGGVMDEKGNIHQMPNMEKMRKEIYAESINDMATKQTIIDAYKAHKLLLEPHGAVGWAGLQNYLKEHPGSDSPEQVCVSLETAHPAKFPEQIIDLLGFDPPLPPSLEGLEGKEEFFDSIENDYQQFKQYLKRRY